MNSYTPGHSQHAADFMARRTLESHGKFFLPYLDEGVSVLDCGCGPGSITLGLAARVGRGQVIGMDLAPSPIKRALASARRHQVSNVRFGVGDGYALPFSDRTFDRIFSHALIEHLADPQRALREWARVLKPGGIIGLCSPDWGGFILSPPSDELSSAIRAYMALQTQNGGDVHAGRKLGGHLTAAGFLSPCLSAHYECYPSLPLIAEYLAVQLSRVGEWRSAETLRAWSRDATGLFAQAWVSAVARKSG